MKEEGVVCRFKIGDSIVYRHGDARQKTSTITDAIVDNNGFGIIHIKDDDGEEGRIFMYISKEEIPRIKLGDKFIYTNAKGEGSEVVANAIIHNKDGLANSRYLRLPVLLSRTPLGDEAPLLCISGTRLQDSAIYLDHISWLRHDKP